jgi:hypothetical protein
MNYIITENQLRNILSEVKDNRFSNDLKTMNSFTKNIVNKTQKTYGINLRFLLKWGSAIGGMVMPLDNWIRTGKFELNDDQIALILIGVACTFFFENKKILKEVVDKIKQEGLLKHFRKALSKGEELRQSFFNFLISLNLTFTEMVDMISYSFLIPIVNDLVDLSHGADMYETAETVAERMVASGTIILTGNIIIEVVNKILKRFSQ